MRKLFAMMMLGWCAAVAHSQVIGLNPTPIASYYWNTSTNAWTACTNSSTAEPYASTPQAFALHGYNASLGQWTPLTACPSTSGGGGGGGLTSFQGRTTAAAVLLLSDVQNVTKTGTNCNVSGGYAYSPYSNTCILVGTNFVAGGDLSGSATSQTVVGIRGYSVANIAPTDGQSLFWSSSLNEYVPGFILTGYVQTLPSASQTVTQPSGTSLGIVGTGSAPFNVTNTATASGGAGINAAHLYAPNLGTGGLVGISLGAATTANNSMLLNFVNEGGTGSSHNYAFLSVENDTTPAAGLCVDGQGYTGIGFGDASCGALTVPLTVNGEADLGAGSKAGGSTLCTAANISSVCGGGPGSGVPSVNGITSAVTIAGTASQIGVTTSGSTVTLTNLAPFNLSALEGTLVASPYTITRGNCNGGVLYQTNVLGGQFTCDSKFQFDASGDYSLLDSVTGQTAIQLDAPNFAQYLGNSGLGAGNSQTVILLGNDNTGGDNGAGTIHLSNDLDNDNIDLFGHNGNAFFAGGVTVGGSLADTLLGSSVYAPCTTTGGVFTSSGCQGLIKTFTTTGSGAATYTASTNTLNIPTPSFTNPISGLTTANCFPLNGSATTLTRCGALTDNGTMVTSSETFAAPGIKTTSVSGGANIFGSCTPSLSDASTTVCGNGTYHVFNIQGTNNNYRSAFSFSASPGGVPTALFELGTGITVSAPSFYIYDGDPAIGSTELYIAPTTGYIGLGNDMQSPAYQLDVLGSTHTSGGFFGLSTTLGPTSAYGTGSISNQVTLVSITKPVDGTTTPLFTAYHNTSLSADYLAMYPLNGYQIFTGSQGFSVNNNFSVDTGGNVVFQGSSAGISNLNQQFGPSTAPSGSCTGKNGAWVFSQDGHATFCNSGTWVSKDSVVATGTGTYSTATSDTFTVSGATSSYVCSFSPTNATAVGSGVLAYVSSVGTNSVTISHAATVASGGTVSILCAPYVAP